MASAPKIYTVYGFTGSLKEIGEKYGINQRTLATRLRLGWSLEMAVSTPVDKSKSSKIGSVMEIGEIRATANAIENRFGVLLSSKERMSPACTIKKIQSYVNPVFFSIGEDYKGSLTAIANDFNCPLTLLKDGLKNGITPEEVLRNNGFTERVAME
jgi:hypothetical protein